MECCILFVTFLLWLFTFVNCEKVCNPLESHEKRCCIHFKYVKGKCIECPKGSFGYDCVLECPNGYYGVRCQGKCNCTHDQICDIQEGCLQNKKVECPIGSFGEQCRIACPDGYYGVGCKETCNCTVDQICDVQEGCVHTNTERLQYECTKGWFGEECKLPCPNGNYGLSCKGTCNCTTDQICDIREGCVQDKTESTSDIIDTTSTEHQTPKSPGYNEGLYWYQLFGIPLGVVIIVMILLTVHTHWKWKASAQESESQYYQQSQEARSQAVEINKITDDSVYDEICEFDTGCSHTHTFTNDFNEISRGKEVNQLQQKTTTVIHLDSVAR